ncbi:MAG: hypothetical protein AAGC58_04325 [Asticcacaulis sp.]
MTGKAAHIYSAAKYGPRGQGILTDEQIRSPANGIWMCSDHSDLIDKNSGNRYAVTTLQSWKALHESRIAFEHSGRLATFGFIRSIRLRTSPLFTDETEIEFAKATLIIGKNGTGKTAICEWLYTLESSAKLLRWECRSGDTMLDADIVFDLPTSHVLTLSVPHKTPNLLLDGVKLAQNPLRISVTYLEKSESWSSYDDDLHLVSNVLHIDKGHARSLAELADDTCLSLKRAEWRRELDNSDNWGERLYVEFRNTNTWQSFGSLSDGQRSRTLLDFAILRAKAAAGFIPSLLTVELKGLGLDWISFKPYMAYFSQSSTPFQTLITSWELTPEMAELGWPVFVIEGNKPHQRIATKA